MRGNALRGDGTRFPDGGKRRHWAKGLWILGGSIGSVALGHRAELSLTHERELGPGQTTEVGADANQRLNLAMLGRPWEENAKIPNRTWENRLSGIIGGPRET